MKQFPLRSLAACAALFLSACEVFQKDTPGQTYGAANPYDQSGGYAAPAYGATTPPATAPYSQPAPGGYGQPTYTQPYTQPTAPAYDAGGYGSTAPAGGNASGRTHKVVSGDTLSGIGRRYSVGVDALIRANNLKGTLIRQGETLTIP